MGIDASISRTAADRLSLLREIAAPAPSAPAAAGRRSGSVVAAAPLHLGILDHVVATAREGQEAVRATVPGASPAPADMARYYEWIEEETAGLDPQRARDIEVLVYRQGLEHAVRAGDHAVLRREQCPRCECWSLQWRETVGRAACLMVRCRDRHNRPSVWSLQQVAEYAIRVRPVRRAT